jgi:NitT/TauT family transport system ATP-binding protein
MNKVTALSKSFNDLKVFADLTLEFPAGKITAILGPSGCGKTTLLNILAGLTVPDSGTVKLDGPVSYVFQEPRLLPWLTVWQNVALVLEEILDREEIKKAVRQYLTAVGVNEYSHFFPVQLSGGLKQRVALARAFAYPADVLLMDEPFKSLDLKARLQISRDFLALWRAAPRTVILVTHDVREAVLLGDKVVLLTEKPAQVRREMEILVPQEERTGGNPKLVEIERRLISELVL